MPGARSMLRRLVNSRTFKMVNLVGLSPQRVPHASSPSFSKPKVVLFKMRHQFLNPQDKEYAAINYKTLSTQRHNLISR